MCIQICRQKCRSTPPCCNYKGFWGLISGKIYFIVRLNFSLLHEKLKIRCFFTTPHFKAHCFTFYQAFFMPKANNQPLEKFLSLAVSLVKVVKNWKSFLKIEWNKNWSFQKMSKTKYVPLKCYSSMKKKKLDRLG